MMRSLFNKIKTLYREKQRGQETTRSILLRGLFWMNRWRYDRLRVMEEDWDYLIILDACRYDVFRDVNTIQGTLTKRYSAGTSTSEWVKENFSGPYYDVVYISANPFLSDYLFEKWLGRPNPFFLFENVWMYGWDDELRAVHPREVNRVALRLLERYGDKRMIIHYLQPHYPYISEVTNRRIREAEDLIELVNLLRSGKVDAEDLKKVYVENLKLVLKYVGELVEVLPQSKIVLSADHGECFGEYGIYSHPSQLYIKQLMEVPWLEIG